MARRRVMSEQQYLNSKGVGSNISDAYTGLDPHINRLGKNTYNQLMKRIRKEDGEYSNKRNQARREYQRLVSSGKVRAPTQAEQTWNTAHGLSENRSVQAARRVLAKHGVDWQTGKRIAPAKGRGLWPTFTHKAKTGKSGG